jgi:hypothetical protein
MTIEETFSIQLLATLPIETCVFPGLLSLSWMVQCMNAGDSRFFLSPTLRHCCVSELYSDFYHIGTRCPALEDFIVPDDSDMALLSEIVRSCKGLRCLYCAPLDSTAWMLSTIPTLLEVKILANA